MGPPSEVTGGIFQDLASFAIFFDLREAAFEHFSPRVELECTWVCSLRYDPVRIGFTQNTVVYAL